MPATPEQLEREIAVTRNELARTLAELEEKANPVRVFRRNQRRMAVVAVAVVTCVILATVTRTVLHRR